MSGRLQKDGGFVCKKPGRLKEDRGYGCKKPGWPQKVP